MASPATVTISDGLIILATLLGPIVAVRVQKWIELLRETRQRKLWVFHTLMATRASRLSSDHVQALNMIDLAFYGDRIFGFRKRTKKEQCVLDAWREYLDHLNTLIDNEPAQQWVSRGHELFVNVLYAIAVEVGLVFDRVQLKKGVYSPSAHGRVEDEQERVRQLAISVLSGEQPLTMKIESMPSDKDGP
ncbi:MULTISPECIES: DUF6680 family protein [Xanthomonas]|uniref:DUF6680 family protein n=1 Tax=Xanthomonas TaxID=338 RepID=UPI000F8E60A0|nr:MULTISPECIES: DUF6680 family protein [Xanthomonas]MBV6689405.1 hypothetical protein [Xanthomonas euvesicatoria pv. physalidis]MBV6847597.1 hypothetical protein [Xanthomonas campestris pv. paulliniae]WPM76594.1 hypothetical protein XVT_21215 [Xanthomonas citri pv. viticola]